MCVDRFNIADVARIHGIEVTKIGSGETYAKCPFCGDTRNKFSYIVTKGKKQNIYKCFNCGAGGTAIDLHIQLSGKDFSGSDGYQKAIKDIFRCIDNNVEVENYHKEVEAAQKEVIESERADDETISSVYYALLRKLTLKKEHKENLLSRGLTEEDIQRYRFRSTPSDGRAICRLLLHDGYNLEGVPGFYIDKGGAWNLNIPGAGYLCPVFDGERNIILGFQIRVDVPKKKCKYLWVSSSGRTKGCGSGAMTTLLPGEDEKTIIITEGILKATVVYALLKGKITVIGVPGVKSLGMVGDYLSRYSSACVFECYDMDKAVKTTDPKEQEKTENIQKDAKRLQTLISDHNLPFHPLTWDTDKEGYWKENYKGLDDFLASYDKKELFVGYLKKKTEEKRKLFGYLTTKQS